MHLLRRQRGAIQEQPHEGTSSASSTGARCDGEVLRRQPNREKVNCKEINFTLERLAADNLLKLLQQVARIRSESSEEEEDV